MRSFGLFVHPARPRADAAGRALRGWLTDRGMETRDYDGADTDDDERARSFAKGVDLIVSIGGDGTFLRAAHVASRTGCPVMGVKVGRMGFLTEIDPDEAVSVLDRAIDGTVRVEERLALLAEPEARASFPPQWALNELIVEKGARHRLIRLAAFVDDVYVTTFSADGVIVATPTGSTAYSFSAGGPIVSPSLSTILVTPIAAHMVFDRSIVLSGDEHVRIEVVGEEAGLLSADGRESIELPVGSSVRIGAAADPARVVRKEGAPPFLELVRDKFDLPEGRRGDLT